MPTQRVMALVNNKPSEYVPLLTSAGSGSSGAIPALDAGGKLDSTFMPAGFGTDSATMLASEAIAAGAFVNVWSNAGVASVRNADGSVANKQADAFTLSAIASGATGTVYFVGVNTGVTGQVAGPVYLSATTAGGSAATGASGAGQTWQKIGMAISATAIEFVPGQDILRA